MRVNLARLITPGMYYEGIRYNDPFEGPHKMQHKLVSSESWSGKRDIKDAYIAECFLRDSPSRDEVLHKRVSQKGFPSK